MQEPDHVFYGFYTVTLVTATVVCVLCVCVCVCVRARACVYRLMDIYDSKKTVDIYTSIKFSASTAEIMRQITYTPISSSPVMVAFVTVLRACDTGYW